MIHLNYKEKALVNSATGEIVRPGCWDTLAPYISYLETRSHSRMAQDVLEKVFVGEKFITKMIENAQKREL